MDNNGKWEIIDKGNLTARHENSFVKYKNKFYLIGGRRDKPVEEYDPVENKWRKLSKPPLEIHHFHAVTVDESIYIVGAMTGGYPYEDPLENIYIYRPDEDEWTKGPEIPEDRRRGSCGTVYYKGKIYMVGGIIDGHNEGLVSWFDCYDLASDTWKVLEDCPRGRDHFPAIVVDDKLYAIGGRDTSYHTEDNFGAFFDATIREVDCYDFNNNQWQTLSEKLPVGTAAGGIANINDTIYYFGGESNQDTAHNETQCLDINTLKWHLDAPLQRGRHGTQAVVYDDSIYIASGSGNRGGAPELSSMEKYSIV